MCVCQWRAGCQIKRKLWQKSKHSKIWRWTLGLRQSCFPPPSGCSPCVRETYDRSFVALRCCSCCLRRTFLKNNRDKKRQRKTGRRKTEWKERKTTATKNMQSYVRCPASSSSRPRGSFVIGGSLLLLATRRPHVCSISSLLTLRWQTVNTNNDGKN